LVEALERGDAASAEALMAEHLGHVERNLRLHPRVPDLAEVLRPAALPQRRPRTRKIESPS
jgi:DNA-binding GntR family transcriptional regulator